MVQDLLFAGTLQIVVENMMLQSYSEEKIQDDMKPQLYAISISKKLKMCNFDLTNKKTLMELLAKGEPFIKII